MSQNRKPMAESKKNPDLETKEVQQLKKASLFKVIDIPDLRNRIINRYLDLDKNSKTLADLSNSCHRLYSFYQPALSQRHQQLQQLLLQAVVDDDRKKVEEILDANPKLLLMIPDANMVIGSKYTWQKFYAENALTMAVKRNQPEMKFRQNPSYILWYRRSQQ
jgi:hypothetical protein